ncbi:MAG: DUF3575 domain-containing protein, partial [Muribaculaceae bacterium]|nr:DUF3575 domain-containing protein [Muribaculaceae bacterium]
ANELLARNRCDVISDYIVENSGISDSLIQKRPSGIAWDALKQLVEETPEIPSRDAVLDILRNTPVWVFDKDGKVIDGRKSQLMSLDRGVPYRWMQKYLFPDLRNAVAITMQIKETPSSAIEIKVVETSAEESANQVEEGSSENSDIAVGSNLNEESDNSDSPATPEYEKKVKHRFALKTNLLYDAVLLPNLELEWLLNNNWSVSLEGDVAWWKPSFTRVYRLAVISPEVRYHIRPRAPWHGMYVGVFGGGGLYQLENRHDGYRGDGGMAGVSFGYMWPIGKHFSLSAGIGAGYMYTRYKVYKSIDGHKLYMFTKSLNYFGPLQLKFSIAWRFDIMTKTVKVNPIL